MERCNVLAVVKVNIFQLVGVVVSGVIVLTLGVQHVPLPGAQRVQITIII
jgi:hypothetical protein